MFIAFPGNPNMRYLFVNAIHADKWEGLAHKTVSQKFAKVYERALRERKTTIPVSALIAEDNNMWNT